MRILTNFSTEIMQTKKIEWYKVLNEKSHQLVFYILKNYASKWSRNIFLDKQNWGNSVLPDQTFSTRNVNIAKVGLRLQLSGRTLA